MHENDFPIELENLLATVAEVLKGQGRTRELAVLVKAKTTVELLEYDNWNGGTYTWGLRCGVDLRFYGSLKDDAAVISKTICETAREFFKGFEDHSLAQVLVIAEPVSNPAWRQEAERSITGRGVTNQGRVRSDNLASIEHDGLLFRSAREVNLYDALKKQQVTFAPLPVFLRRGRPRAEPDFVIVRRGLVTVIEVDSTSYHHERPVEAQENRRLLEDEGARIIRIDGSECATPQR